MNKTWCMSLLTASCLLLASSWVLTAQESTSKKDAKPASPDEMAIGAAAAAFTAAFEKGDVKAFSSLFTEQAEYVDENMTLNGRAEIEKGYAEFFAKRKAIKAEGTSNLVKLIGSDTAIEDGTFTVKAEGEAPVSTRYSTLYVREKGKWLIALLKEWREAPTAKGLEDLAWLVGAWEADGKENSVRTSYEWTPNHGFLKSHFTIESKADKKTVASGTEVIGYDPTSDTVRSWIFGDEGGFSEGVWTWDGNQWISETAGFLPSGQQVTASNFMTPGKDSFTWRSVERTLDGAAQPDIPQVTVKRASKAK